MNKLSIVAMASIIILAVLPNFGCGKTTDSDYSTTFDVISFSPNVFDDAATTDPLIIVFNKPLAAASINQTSISVQQTSGSSTITVTGYAGTVDTTTVQYLPVAGKWESGVMYFVTVTTSVRSIDNEPLPVARSHSFAVGTMNNLGSLPGDPTIIATQLEYLTPEEWAGHCMVFWIEFNEELNRQPDAYVTASFLGSSNYVLTVTPVFYTTSRIVRAWFPDGGCDTSWFTTLTLHVFGATDTDNNPMDPWSKSYTVW